MDGESRWMWLGLGVITFAAYHLLRYQLSEIRRITEVYENDQDDKGPRKQGLEVLRVASLKTLSESPNYELQQAAVKVICERILKGRAFRLLLREVSDSKIETRDRALRGLAMLIENGLMLSLLDSHQHEMMVTALIDCLVNMRIHSRVQSTAVPPSDSGYITALYILCTWLPNHLNTALDAGLVTRWLRFYPFAETSIEVQVVVWKLIVEKPPDPLSQILWLVSRHAWGRKQLVQFGLLNFKLAEAIDPDVRYPVANGQYRGIVMELPLNEGSPRVHTETDDQQQIRRRRREAMVLSDGEHPLDSNDIIQRSGE